MNKSILFHPKLDNIRKLLPYFDDTELKEGDIQSFLKFLNSLRSSLIDQIKILGTFDHIKEYMPVLKSLYSESLVSAEMAQLDIPAFVVVQLADFTVQLKKIHCEQQEDYTGKDDILLEVRGGDHQEDENRRMKTGENWDLNENRWKFKVSAGNKLQVWITELDDYDPNDKFGPYPLEIDTLSGSRVFKHGRGLYELYWG